MKGQHHTFGGLGLDRFLYDHETAEAADPLAAGAGAGDATTGDTAGAAAAEPQASAEPGGDTQAVAPATPDLGFDPREVLAELEHTRAQNQLLLEQIQGRQTVPDAGAGDGNGAVSLDPFDDSFGSNLQKLIQESIAGAVQPLTGRFEQQDAAAIDAEGQQRITDMIADDASRNGEFVPGDEQAEQQSRELVRTIAESLFPAFADRYGVGARAAEFAIEKAAGQVRGLLKANADAAVARHTNHTATLAGARSEPGGAGAGTFQSPTVTGSGPVGVPRAGSLARKYGTVG